jgi:hypothetical protein
MSWRHRASKVASHSAKALLESSVESASLARFAGQFRGTVGPLVPATQGKHCFFSLRGVFETTGITNVADFDRTHYAHAKEMNGEATGGIRRSQENSRQATK